jgi:hypothetical protein
MFLFPVSAKAQLTPHSNATSDSDTWDDDRCKVIAWALNLLFNLKLTIYITHIIIKFANFQLTTRMFRVQSIYAIFLGVLGLVVSLFHEADQHVSATLLMGCEVLVNIAIFVYVVVVLRMVGGGKVEEMKRPGNEEVVVEVELESGRKEAPML